MELPNPNTMLALAYKPLKWSVCWYCLCTFTPKPTRRKRLQNEIPSAVRKPYRSKSRWTRTAPTRTARSDNKRTIREEALCVVVTFALCQTQTHQPITKTNGRKNTPKSHTRTLAFFFFLQTQTIANVTRRKTNKKYYLKIKRSYLQYYFSM